MSPQSTVMAGKLGDIFWDLPPWLTYTPGFDIGCSIYVANHSDAEKEYALMARLTRDTTVISEEALPVFGYTWFKVDPNDFISPFKKFFCYMKADKSCRSGYKYLHFQSLPNRSLV